MILGLDIGSSSIKAALLSRDRVVGNIARIEYSTCFNGPRAEVDPNVILKSIARAVSQLGGRAKRADAIAFSVMSPAWLAMDKRGRPLTPIVTHQDRRSFGEAIDIEQRIGKARHLAIAGVRPVPGGISSTTWEWFRRHHPSLLRRADLVGHLNTFLIRTLTGERIIDPSNASFMGVYSTLKMGGWSKVLCENVRLSQALLPEILESNQIAGRLHSEGSRLLHLPVGLPVLAGMIDTSAAMLVTEGKSGQLLNVCGSTDVLALLTDRPKVHERLITRAFGIGKRWMSVSTLAAAGSAIQWARDELFADYSWPRFNRLLDEVARLRVPPSVQFDPYLAGDRMSIEQRRGAFQNLTLATTRRDMLHAIIDSLAVASAARLPLLLSNGIKASRRVAVTGRGFDQILRRDWPGRWQFVTQTEASLRGLGKLIEG
jgi:xylulokinase